MPCAEFKFTFAMHSAHMRWCIMNWYLSQFWYIIFSCLSRCLHAMSWTICRNENVSHFYCCTNRHLFLQCDNSTKKMEISFRIDDVDLLRRRYTLMDRMECQWLNLLISPQFVASYFLFLSRCRWINSAKCAASLLRAFISAHLPARAARWVPDENIFFDEM